MGSACLADDVRDLVPDIQTPKPGLVPHRDATRAVQQVFLYDTPRCTGACSAAVYQKVYKTAAGNAIVAMMGTVPGYFFTVAFVDVLGRIPIQFAGELAWCHRTIHLDRSLPAISCMFELALPFHDVLVPLCAAASCAGT